jgi:uncharacterized protein (UPF0212 family)
MIWHPIIGFLGKVDEVAVTILAVEGRFLSIDNGIKYCPYCSSDMDAAL